MRQVKYADADNLPGFILFFKVSTTATTTTTGAGTTTNNDKTLYGCVSQSDVLSDFI